ncbi:hypothetical protein V5F72_02035 [Xanthobacter flavus]|uniref:hypothetical protein n=1 Tax=Xanthobacter flavus TaxID=281 RepID=UPI00372B07B1
MRLALACAVLAASALPARATDRPVTEAERGKLEAAMKDQNCSGGEWEFDDGGYFEIDNARCGRVYDLKFSTDYRLIEKKPD